MSNPRSESTADLSGFTTTATVFPSCVRKISSLDIILKKIESLTAQSDSIRIVLNKTKDYCLSDDDKIRIQNMLDKHEALEQHLCNIEQKQTAFNRIDHDGREIKKEKELLDKEIKAFYADNIPLVIMSTNDDLCSSLKVTKNTVVDVLNTKWLNE